MASFASVADCDAIIDAGMSRGVRDGHDRLAELLTTLLAGAQAG